MSDVFKPGMTRELKIRSLPEHSAQRFYPNLPDVFATPCLGGLMERVSAELINEHLKPGEQSVGISMNLVHSAATPLGWRSGSRPKSLPSRVANSPSVLKLSTMSRRSGRHHTNVSSSTPTSSTPAWQTRPKRRRNSRRQPGAVPQRNGTPLV